MPKRTDGETRSELLTIRVGHTERAEWQRAAKASGESMADVARAALHKWAKKIINEGK